MIESNTAQLWPIAGAFAFLLTLIHLFAGQLRFLDVMPRSRWLSAAGGASVAYVFVHVLPDLSRAQATVEQAGAPGPRYLENHVYLLALLGMVMYYGVERAVKVSHHRSGSEHPGEEHLPGIFWLHIASFAVYNGLVGYLLLHREVPGALSLTFFGLAMSLHFLVNDYGLRQQQKGAYRRVGRWVLAVAILIGWGTGLVTTVHEAVVSLLFAFLAGGVILNVLKEELPEERRSSFLAFSLGAIGYTLLLLFV